jgi:hypothetical protein
LFESDGCQRSWGFLPLSNLRSRAVGAAWAAPNRTEQPIIRIIHFRNVAGVTGSDRTVRVKTVNALIEQKISA